MSARNSRCVFVGNIPYDATEEHLMEIFSSVGPVSSFRLVHDRDTGKPKGYGFCEYRDQDTAMSAMRNLNNFDLLGRTLRVDFAENEKAGKESERPSRGGPSGGSGSINVTTVPNATPILPSSTTSLMSSLIPADPVSATLSSTTQQQLFEFMVQLKLLSRQHPDQFRHVLIQNPQISRAILQAQMQLGIAKPQGLSAPAPAPYPTTGFPSVVPMGAAGFLGASAPPVPVPVPMGSAAPPSMIPMGPLGGAPNIEEQHKNLLHQVMNLTPQQLEALEPSHRQQLLILQQAARNQLGGFR